MLLPHERTTDGENAESDAEVNVTLALACTLPPTRRAARRADIGALLERVHRRKDEPDGVILSFAASESIAQALLEFMLAERQCCPQMTYELLFPAGEPVVALRVRSPVEHILAVRTLYGGLPAADLGHV
jgi:hypothetical protein